MFAPWTLNHNMPFLSKSGVCGSRAASGSRYSVTSPVAGFSLPM